MVPKILFVCYGNVGRSQMAEAYYNKYTNSNNGASAGVGYDVGERYKHSTEDIIKVMREDGIDLSRDIVKPLTKQMVDDCDKVIVMCDIDDCPKYLLDSKKIEHVPVSDPFGISLEYVREIRDDIKRRVLDLMHSF